ncbi:MAG TPA: alpha/beta fold hydrolase [Pseudonocardia sp.]|jgi:pimeloyl-ACP methyl ester carboxylesterase|uniref:alpha/beta fold hydrolase n=1 Tax=Pseudonocardia sp. TaxID=60912 RepID=UPI002B4B0B42|nr:alpha/beta fold hydrolase [Pseudonocardia sp.]HLU56725.1 alpha/beta fold hydrolase [Pseudonocardia sp.]
MASTNTRTATNREVRRPHDTTIRYTISGPAGGPVLALVHGWGCNRTDFDAVTDHLPSHLRVLAVDLAEHGESRSARDVWTMEEFARDVAAVLDAESVESCVVAGHSLGGAVAVEVARLLPDVVSHVVALDALHYLGLFPAQDEVRTDAFLKPFHDDFAAATRAMVESGSPAGTDPALTNAYFEKMVAVRQPAGLRSIEGLVHWDMDAALRDVRQPITLFAVREILAQEAVDRYGDRIRIVPVDLGTHHFPVESPRGTADLLAGIVPE